MKKGLFIMLLAAWAGAGYAQEDTTAKKNEPKAEKDTIRVGNILIIRTPGSKDSDYDDDHSDSYHYKRHRSDRVTTNWMIVDLGYSGFTDNTDYSSPEAQAFLHNPNGTPLYKGDFNIKGTRISNFSLWFFMQRRNLYKGIINLKYGIGIENNNYYYKTPITYVDGATPYVFRDSVSFGKNKIALDYLTVPLMINFNTNPDRHSGGFTISFGVSGGWLYSSRQKQESDERGKKKNKTDFNFSNWKAAYIAELGLGPIKIYGSYAITKMHEFAIDQRPYNVGLRLSVD